MSTTSLPLVSIITPSYNQAEYIEEAILSVLTQDYPNVEYILVDGGSTDGSVAIIEKYAHRLAYWVSEPDDGQSAALNKGMKHAAGEIWAWMNADDAYTPNAIRQAVEWLQAHPDVDILYGDCTLIDINGVSLGAQPTHEYDEKHLLLGRGAIPSGSTFMRQNVIEKVGFFNEKLHFVMDVEYWLRATKDCRFGYLPQNLSFYRLHDKAKTIDATRSDSRARELIQIYQDFWATESVKSKRNALRRRSQANTYLYAADLARKRGERDTCINYLLQSFQFGVAIIQIRLVRLGIYLLFGEKTTARLKKIWRIFFPSKGILSS